MKAIEFGPGRHPVNKDWFCVDVIAYKYVDLVHDVRQLPLPLPNAEYDLAYLSHILEHIPWFQTVDFLKEIHRILRYRATIEVWVPDFYKIVQGYKSFSTVKDRWRRHNPKNDKMLWVNGRIFTHGPGEENWHRAVFDSSSLKACLKEAGFRHCDPLTKPRGYDHGWINLGMAAVK